MPEKAVTKYLSTYAEPEAKFVNEVLNDSQWDQVVVIPCYHESDLIEECLRALDDAAANLDCRPLILLVVNGKENDNTDIHADNAKTIKLANEIDLKKIFVQVMDRASVGQRLPNDQGVGLARKIGADCALALWSIGKVKSPWIYNTDADARVPRDYFERWKIEAEYSAINVSFRHAPVDPNAQSWKALQKYETSLHYYVQGLKYAGSPYGFHTIGSSIIVDAPSYAKVRGFPKRMAGEDFYILNKLAKVGRIYESHRTPQLILDRPSDRVPFGTGAAVNKICHLFKEGDEYTLYHPRTFEVLKQFLEFASNSKKDLCWTSFCEQSSISKNLGIALDSQLGMSVGLAGMQEKTNQSDKNQAAFYTWFDALKHLRFIHIVRDNEAPNLPFQAALEEAFWWVKPD